MDFINKFDNTAVNVIHYFEEVRGISQIMALGIQFSKWIEPYVFVLLKYIPLNLTFYRESRIYLYLDSKPYEEFSARFWKGNVYVTKDRRSFDELAFKKNPECLNFTFFQHYANDPKMILSLANDSIETRKKLEKVKVFDLHVQADGSNLDQLQEKIAEKSVDLFKDLSIQKAVEKAEQLLALYDKPSDKVIQDITSFYTTNFNKKDFFILLFKNLGPELVKRIVNANRSLISYSPPIIRNDPEYVYKECFSELKDLNFIQIDTFLLLFDLPANVKILSENEENLKNQEFLTKLFISAQKDRIDGCQFLLFSILINFENSGENFFKPFFSCLAKLVKDEGLKNFFHPSTDLEKLTSFSSTLRLYFSPTTEFRRIFKNSHGKVFNLELFSYLDEYWKNSSDFIVEYLIDMIPYVKSSSQLWFFHYVALKDLDIDFLEFFEKFIKTAQSSKRFASWNTTYIFEAICSQIPPESLSQEAFISNLLTLTPEYVYHRHAIVKFIFGDNKEITSQKDNLVKQSNCSKEDGKKIGIPVIFEKLQKKVDGTPLKYDATIMNSFCNNNPWLIETIHEDVWKSIIETNSKFIDEFEKNQLLLITHESLFQYFSSQKIITIFSTGVERFNNIANRPQAVFQSICRDWNAFNNFLTDEMIEKLFLEIIQWSPLLKSFLRISFENLVEGLLRCSDYDKEHDNFYRRIFKKINLISSKHESIKSYLMDGYFVESLMSKFEFFHRYFKLLPEDLKYNSAFIKKCVELIKKRIGFRQKNDMKFFKHVNPSKVDSTENFTGYIELLKPMITMNRHFTSNDSCVRVFKFLSKEIENNEKLTAKIIEQCRGLNETYSDTISDLLKYLFSKSKINCDFILNLLKSEEIFFYYLPKKVLSGHDNHHLKWLVNFPWLIKRLKLIENQLLDKAININPAVLPWILYNEHMHKDLYFRWIQLNIKNPEASDVIIRATILPRIQRSIESFARELFKLFSDRKLNIINDYPSFIDKFVKILPELKFYIPEIIVEEYSKDGSTPENKKLEFWNGAISAGWHREILENIKTILLCCKTKKIPKIILKIIVGKIMLERMKESCRKIGNY